METTRADVRSLLLHCEAADIASQTVHNVMIEAESSGEHTQNTWTLEGDQHHIRHAVDHLRYSPSREDLEHAICRLAMAIWCQEHNILGDNGSEGKGEERWEITEAGIAALDESAPERPWGEVCSH